jgi:hypothetical protein
MRAGFDRGLDEFALLVHDVTAPVKDVAAGRVETILANNKCPGGLVIGSRAILTCHFHDRSRYRYLFGGGCRLPFTLRLWLRKCQRRQQCAADENRNWFLHVIPPVGVVVVPDGWFSLYKGIPQRALQGNLDFCRLRLIFSNGEASR